MNWLDNLIGWLNPVEGAKRAAYRSYMEELRSYDAGTDARLNAGWRAFNESAEESDRPYREIVRARARDLERNSDVANSVLSAFERNVIGYGYTLKPKTGDEELDKEIQKQWKTWCKARNCDVTGMQPFNEMMRMCLRRKKIDGGFLIKKCIMKGKKIPLQLQVLEVDELASYVVGPTHGSGNRTVGGIEYNQYNKIVGYWIKQYDINGYETNKATWVDEKDIIYLYSKRRPSQIREMSDMSQSITRIRDTNEYMTAISVKERITACLAVFIKKQMPVSTGRINANASNKNEYAGKTIVPGMIRELNPGDEIQSVNPSGQATDAQGMIKLHQRMIGAGQGLSYETTSRDMSQSNYSSARQGAIEDDLTYVSDKDLMKDNVYDEIYESFIISAYLSGAIQFKGDFWREKERFLDHEWVKIPKAWIDPQKEANANKIALVNGIKTYQQVAAEQGKDWKEQISEIAQVLNYGKELGIDLGGILYGQDESEIFIDEDGKTGND